MPSVKQSSMKRRKPNKRERKRHLASIRGQRKSQLDATAIADASLEEGDADAPHTPSTLERPSTIDAPPTSQALDAPPISSLTASASKLAACAEPSVSDSTWQSILPTTIVDLNCLQPLLQDIRCSMCREGYLHLCCHGDSQGFAVKLIMECNFCGFIKGSAFTSKRMPDKSFLVNRAAVAASLAGGFGYSGIRTTCEFLNMPLISEPSFQYHADKIHDRTENFKKSILDKSVSIVRKAYKDSTNPDLSDSDYLDITVSYDGSWHTRGHTSNSGIGCVIDTKTGLVIDYHIMCKFCKLCATEGERVRKTSERDYVEWKEKHEPYCGKNFNLSSGAMEVEAALVCWGRSQDRGLRYLNVISDGDCKTIKKINENQPYGSVEVQKEECVNHVAKRLGKALRELVETKKKQKITLGGRGEGKLTQIKINKMQKYYTKAIRSNNTLEGMKESVMATFLHCTSTDENPNHGSCPEGVDSWCFYQRATARNETPPSHKLKTSCYLSPDVAKHVKIIFERMSSDDLLSRCLSGKTQNANESLHSVLWSRCPKNIFVNRKRLETSIAVAVGEFNEGSTASRRFMKMQGLELGEQSTLVGIKRDKRRAYFSSYAENEKNKRRKRIRDESKRKENAELLDQEREREGALLYEAGGDD